MMTHTYRRGDRLPGRHKCACGYDGRGWTYVGWQDGYGGGYHMANCPQCRSTRAVRLDKERVR